MEDLTQDEANFLQYRLNRSAQHPAGSEEANCSDYEISLCYSILSKIRSGPTTVVDGGTF